MKFCTIPILLSVVLCVFSAGCNKDFDEDVIKGRAEASPVQLDSEQVSLNLAEVGCGVSNDLWQAGSQEAGQRTVYRLTQKARDLQFSDDVYANDPGFPAPYTQLRGKFYLQLDKTVAVNDGPDPDTKLVQARIGVKIPHPCFTTPLAIMGIRKGNFTTELAPTFQYEKADDGWRMTQLVH